MFPQSLIRLFSNKDWTTLHLLLPLPHPQVSDPLNGLLDVGLLVSLYVDVALQALLGDHRLDLERLQEENKISPNTTWIVSISYYHNLPWMGTHSLLVGR